MAWIVLICLLGAVSYARGDCYPGDTTYTAIVQEVYHGVTSDRIRFDGQGWYQTRQQLCTVLTGHHNNGKNGGQSLTNSQYLGYVTVTESACRTALTYTQGYNSLAGWARWAGHHSGKWYSTTNGGESDPAVWSYPSYKPGGIYALQPVRFDSQYRIDHCVTRDSTGATCRYGWNQSGQGVLYIWGWDPKDDGCTPGGRRGAHVGFPFDVGSAHCIVWVTPEEAFLECVNNRRRTSTTSGSGTSEGYGQWTIS